MPSCGNPEKSAGLRFSLIFPTAAPTHGFGAKSTLSFKPRVKIQSPHKIRIKTALSGFESAVRFCLYSFC